MRSGGYQYALLFLENIEDAGVVFVFFVRVPVVFVRLYDFLLTATILDGQFETQVGEDVPVAVKVSTP